MNTDNLERWLGVLDKEIFPNDPAPISRGKTKNNAPAQYQRVLFFSIPIEEYVVSDQPGLEDSVSELVIVVHEIRHRVQCNLLQKEFMKWNSFKVKTMKNVSESSRRIAAILTEPENLHEFDAGLCGVMAEFFNNNPEEHLEDIKKLLRSSLKESIKILKNKGIILKRKSVMPWLLRIFRSRFRKETQTRSIFRLGI